MENRNFKITQIRKSASRRLEGHAAIFNEPTDIGPFYEMVLPGAFYESIQRDDIRALWNHDENFILGRNTSGTLQLYEDAIGLKVVIDPPDSQFASDLIKSVERGDVNQMSFSFKVIEEEWSKKGQKDLRKLKKVQLFDVSPCTFPAYQNTDIGVSSRSAWQKNQVWPNNVLMPLAGLESSMNEMRHYSDISYLKKKG